MRFPKVKTVRSESYRRFVAQHPCFACGLYGFSQAAHPNHGRGLGQKSSDLDCFPLCAPRPGVLGCHAEHDQLIGLSLDARREREKQYTARMKFLARGVGRPEVE
jgi:hypothetical protein